MCDSSRDESPWGQCGGSWSCCLWPLSERRGAATLGQQGHGVFVKTFIHSLAVKQCVINLTHPLRVRIKKFENVNPGITFVKLLAAGLY